MIMIRLGVVISFIVVCLTSAIALVFAFSNYSIAIKATRDSIDGIRESLRNDSTSNMQLSKTRYDTTDQHSIEKVARILDRMESVKDSSFNSNTLSFLFTVFSILFISVGMYLYSETDKRLSIISNNLSVQNWTSITNAFLSYLLSLETTITNIRGDHVTLANVMAESRLYLGLIEQEYNKMKWGKIGISDEQRGLFLQLSGSIDSRYQTILLQSDGVEENNIYIEEIILFQQRLQDLSQCLETGPFVTRWNEAIKND
jgi:hypothetical protein